MGQDNGKEMFDMLEEEVARYNERWDDLDGKAVLQPFEGKNAESCDSGSDSESGSAIKQDKQFTKPPSKKKRKINQVKQLLILSSMHTLDVTGTSNGATSR